MFDVPDGLIRSTSQACSQMHARRRADGSRLAMAEVPGACTVFIKGVCVAVQLRGSVVPTGRRNKLTMRAVLVSRELKPVMW